MQHELFVALAHERVDFLLVGGGSEGDSSERLGLAAGEDRGTMRTREHLDLRAERANLGRTAIVDTLILFEDGRGERARAELSRKLRRALLLRSGKRVSSSSTTRS